MVMVRLISSFESCNNEYSIVGHRVKRENDNKYVGDNKMCVGAYKNMTFTELVETVYTIMRIDKTRYNINIHFVTKPSSNLLASKFLIKDNHGVKFIMFDESRYKVIYVDTTCKDAGISNLHNQSRNQLPSYSGGNLNSSVAIPLVSACSPLWNDDFGIYGMDGLSNGAPHTNDDGDNKTNDNGDDEGGASLKYSKVRFSSLQFETTLYKGT